MRTESVCWVMSLGLGRVLTDCRLKQRRFTNSTAEPKNSTQPPKSQMPSGHTQQIPRGHEETSEVWTWPSLSGGPLMLRVFFFHSALKRCITIIVFSMKSPHKNKNVRPFQDSFTVTVSRLTAAYYGSQVYFYIVHDYEDTEQQLWHHKHASLPCRAESITVLSDTETLDLFIDSLIVWLVIYINLFL